MLMLKQIRELRGMTLKDLSDAVGQTQGSISHYETGRREPNFETLLKLGEALNCSVDSLLGNNFALTVDEETLLYFFRQLNDLGQRQLLKMASAYSKDEDFAEKNSADTETVSA